MGFVTPTLHLSRSQHERILAHCYDGLPNEACGLLGGLLDADGEPTGAVTAVYPCRNADESAKTYTIEPVDMLRAARDAEDRGDEIIGGWHSHTHTDPYPSPTDVDKARMVGPAWMHVLVSLKDDEPVLRAYRIRDGVIGECAVLLEDDGEARL
jgi:[CysO sulfur-carrier protein]-S-L-cysteine hydrolase